MHALWVVDKVGIFVECTFMGSLFESVKLQNYNFGVVPYDFTGFRFFSETGNENGGPWKVIENSGTHFRFEIFCLKK